MGSRETAYGAVEQVGVARAREGHFSCPHFSVCKIISSPNPTSNNGSKQCLLYLEENRVACHVLFLRLCWSSHRFQSMLKYHRHTFILKVPKSVRLEVLQEFRELDGWSPSYSCNLMVSVQTVCLNTCVNFKPRAYLSALSAGLQLTPDPEEWEVVFPALWRREESLDAAGGSGGSADPGWGRGAGGGGRAQAAGSSREVRSVARAPQEEAAGGQPESWFESTPQPGGEDEEELESQELPRGSSGDTALSSGSPSSWQPLSPPQPPPAQQEESSTEEVLLRIPALSRDLYLLLRRDGRFLAQRFAVEQWPNPGPEPTRAEADPRPHTPPDAACFYTGTVLHHPGSLASFSTCGGGLVSALPSPARHSIPYSIHQAHLHAPPPPFFEVFL